MLFVLIVLLLVASVFVLLMKKNRESLCLLGMCCSLMVQFSGILIFIAKKGGYSRSIINFLFFSQALRNKLQYLFITLPYVLYQRRPYFQGQRLFRHYAEYLSASEYG